MHLFTNMCPIIITLFIHRKINSNVVAFTHIQKFINKKPN